MFGEALRLLRIRAGLTQTAASKLEGAPDYRTLSHWETRRKMPSLRLLRSYLTCMDLDFCDLQAALYQVEGTAPKRLQDGLKRLEHRVMELERILGVEVPSPEEDAGADEDRPAVGEPPATAEHLEARSPATVEIQP